MYLLAILQDTSNLFTEIAGVFTPNDLTKVNGYRNDDLLNQDADLIIDLLCRLLYMFDGKTTKTHDCLPLYSIEQILLFLAFY